MSIQDRKISQLTKEYQKLKRENDSLIERLATLELDLTERVNALENNRITVKTIHVIGDCYR
jgi:chaperonin cofactor prefoldin